MSIRNVLSVGCYWQVNKILAEKVGLESAVMLSELVSKYAYHEDNDQLIKIGKVSYIYATANSLKDVTTLCYKSQKSAIKRLVDAGFISVKLHGVPAKLHFTINEDSIWKILKTSVRKAKPSMSQKIKLETAKSENYCNKNIINKNKENKKITDKQGGNFSDEKCSSSTPRSEYDLKFVNPFVDMESAKEYLRQILTEDNRYLASEVSGVFSEAIHWLSKNKTKIRKNLPLFIKEFIDDRKIKGNLEITNKPFYDIGEGHLNVFARNAIIKVREIPYLVSTYTVAQLVEEY